MVSRKTFSELFKETSVPMMLNIILKFFLITLKRGIVCKIEYSKLSLEDEFFEIRIFLVL